MNLKRECRAFFAFPIAIDISRLITHLQSQMGNMINHYRWINPEQTHITIVFLGTIPLQVAQRLAQTARIKLDKTPSFSLHFGALGAFPDPSKARVLWLGLRHIPSELLKIRNILISATESLGIELDKKPFKPHLTLARCNRQHSGCNLSDQLKSECFHDSHNIIIDECVLYNSELRSTGPVYSRMATFDLI